MYTNKCIPCSAQQRADHLGNKNIVLPPLVDNNAVAKAATPYYCTEIKQHEEYYGEEHSATSSKFAVTHYVSEGAQVSYLILVKYHITVKMGKHLN